MGRIGGERGIRTLGTLARTTVFETAPFDHSGTSPQVFWVVGGADPTGSPFHSQLAKSIPNPLEKTLELPNFEPFLAQTR